MKSFRAGRLAAPLFFPATTNAPSLGCWLRRPSFLGRRGGLESPSHAAKKPKKFASVRLGTERSKAPNRESRLALDSIASRSGPCWKKRGLNPESKSLKPARRPLSLPTNPHTSERFDDTMASNSATALRTAKRQLRKSMAHKLSLMRADEIASQSHKVAEQVLRSQTYAQARAISVYIHMNVGEVVTDHICRSILKDGKRLYVPLFASPATPAVASGPTVPEAPAPAKTEFATDMIMLRLRDVAEYESMAANRWGIREPPLTYEDGTMREQGKSPRSVLSVWPSYALTPSHAYLCDYSSGRSIRRRRSRPHPCAWSRVRRDRRSTWSWQGLLRPLPRTRR